MADRSAKRFCDARFIKEQQKHLTALEAFKARHGVTAANSLLTALSKGVEFVHGQGSGHFEVHAKDHVASERVKKIWYD